nr:DUF6318 family protein [Auritidibacter ignavus]
MRTVPKSSLTPSTERRRHRFASVFSCSGLVLLGLVLAGCSSDDTNHNASALDATVPDEEHQTATSQDPSPTEYIPASEDGPAQNVPVPEKPEALSELTEEGMKAAALYWWDAYNYTTETGDTGPTEEVSAESCEFCQDEIEVLEAHYAAGRYAEGVKATPTIEEVASFDPDSQQGEVNISVEQAPGEVFDSDGTVLAEQSVDERNHSSWKMDMAFDETDSSWRLTQMWLYTDHDA